MCMNWRMVKLSQRTKGIAGCLALLLLGSALSGCSLLPQEEAELQPPLVKPAKENYQTVIAKKGTITKDIRGNGNFVSVSSDIAQFTGEGGRIKEIAVTAGDEVHKGDILASLIQGGMDLELKEQELALERAKYAYKGTAASDKDARRIASLQVEIEQLKYTRLKEQLNSKVIRSTIDGQVTFAESMKEGDFVEPYQTLAIVSDPNRLRLTVTIDAATDLSQIDVGTTAEVKVNKEQYAGTVVQTPSSAPSTLNKELAEKYAKTLYIEVQDLSSSVKIGTLAAVRIITQQISDTIVIPKNGLRTYLGRRFVRVLEDGSRLREVDVESGIESSTEVEIVKGLEEGEVVVLQ